MANPPLILFADRDSHGRMGQLLEQAGYAVAACQIEVVRDTAAQLRPLVIVVDAQLLVGAHAGLLDLLKLSSTASIPVILTSKGKRENLAPGCERFQLFSRPIDREKLFLAINAYDFDTPGGQPVAS